MAPVSVTSKPDLKVTVLFNVNTTETDRDETYGVVAPQRFDL